MISRKAYPFSNVAAGQIASLELPRGMTMLAVILEVGGTSFSISDLERISVKLNGKTFYEITGDHQDLLNKYKNVADDTDNLTIWFGEPTSKSVDGLYAGAIGTQSGVGSFTMEVKIAATASGPTLAARYIEVAPTPLGLINCMLPYPVNFSAGGKWPITLPHGKEAGFLIERVLFFHSNLTALEVKKNGVEVWQEMTVAEADQIAKIFKMVPQSGLYVYDPVVNGDRRGVLNTQNAQTLTFEPTVSGADALSVYSECIGYLEKV